MGIGAITIDTVGAQTAPTSLSLTSGAALSSTLIMKDYGVKDVLFFPSLKAVMFCDGLDFQWHVIDSNVYLTGPIAPSTAPTLTPTAARATAVLTFTGASAVNARPADGDVIQVGRAGGLRAGYIYCKTTLDATATENQVLIGANVDATISNLTKFINGTGIQGTDYYSYRMAVTGDKTPGYADYEDIEVSTSQAYGVPSATTATITIRARTYGVTGNNYNAREITDSGGVMSGMAAGVMAGGAAGTGSAPEPGDYDYGYAYYRVEDGAFTGMSPTTANEQAANGQVSVAMTAAPARNGTVYYRGLRTVTDGTVYYRLEDKSTSPITDAYTDAQITTDFAIAYDPSVSRTYGAGYPPRYRYHTLFKGCVFGAGAILAGIIDDSSTVTLTANSMTGTLSAGKIPQTDWIGRTFRVDSTTDEYVITDVTPATPSITLNRGAVAAAAGSSYTIKDDRDPFEVYWSAALLPNNWPVTNSLKGVYSPDPSGITGLTTAWDSLVVHTRTGVWRIVGEPDSGFQILPVGEGWGCYTSHACVNVEGTLYWLGPDGIFAWNGAGDPRSLSNPEVTKSGQPLGISGTLDRINLDAVDGIVAQFNPTENIIRWWVPLDSSPYNTHVIVYDTQTGAFSLDDCGPVTCAGLLCGPDGDYHTVVGTAFGEVWQLDLGTSDGGYGAFEPVQTVSAYDAATQTITLSGTPGLPTSGLEGCRFIHVTSGGAVQHGTVRETTASTVVLVSALSTAPVASDKIILGGIELSIRTGRSNFAAPDSHKTLSSVTANFTHQSDGQLWCAAGYDSNDPTVFTLRSGTVDVADLTKTDGEHQFTFRRGKGRRFTIQFLALTPGYDVEIHGYVPVFRVRAPEEQVS